MLLALKQKNFAPLFFALLISEIGNNIYRIALLFLVYTLTNQSIWIAITIAIQLITIIVLGPILTAWIDKVDRRRVLIIGDFIRVFLVIFIPLVGYQFFALLMVIVFLNEVVGSIYNPTLNSSLPELLPAQLIDQGNALITFTYRFTEEAFTGITGLLIATTGAKFAFWIDGLTFLISACILLLLPNLYTQQASSYNIWQKIAESIKFLLQNHTLKFITITVFAAALFGSVETTLGIVLAIKTLNVGSAGFGFMEGIFALGTIVGIFIIPYLTSKKLPRIYIFFISLILLGLSLSSAGYYPVYWWVLVAYLITGILNMGFVIPARSFLQIETPVNIRTGVMSVYSAVVKSAVLTGSFFSALLEKKTGTGPVFLFFGLLIFITSSCLFAGYIFSTKKIKVSL